MRRLVKNSAMFLLVTTLYVLQRTLAVPIPDAILDDRDLSTVFTCTGASCRSLWNIVWSCIVTIFACTWVAVHPNVPTAEQNACQRWYSSPLRRLRIMLYALIGPEFILIWAWRQRTVAYRKSETLKDWSRVHGFFAVMGGFVDGKEVLSLKRIEQLVQTEQIEYPIVSRQELQDRSKGDAVAKLLAVSQTTWFILQCAARASRGLALTELEISTAAFAVLNIAVYLLWWDKPLDVQCPIRVRRRRSSDVEESHGEEQDEAQEENESGGRFGAWNWHTFFHGWSSKDVVAVMVPFFAMMGLAKDDAFLAVGERRWEDKTLLYSARSQPDRLEALRAKIQEVNEIREHSLLSLGRTILVATVFGGIHCIGWSFDFPSHTEQLIWRTSSISITAIPLGIVVSFLILGYFRALATVLALSLIPLYIVVRLMLLVVSLTTLRSLPSSAFQTIEWTTFLPHV